MSRSSKRKTLSHSEIENFLIEISNAKDQNNDVIVMKAHDIGYDQMKQQQENRDPQHQLNHPKSSDIQNKNEISSLDSTLINHEETAIREFCKLSFKRSQQLEAIDSTSQLCILGKNILNITNYPILTRRLLKPDLYLHPASSIEAKKTLLLSLSPMLSEAEEERLKEATACELFTRCKSSKGKSKYSFFDYVDIDTQTKVSYSEYEKRYLMYISNNKKTYSMKLNASSNAANNEITYLTAQVVHKNIPIRTQIPSPSSIINSNSSITALSTLPIQISGSIIVPNVLSTTVEKKFNIPKGIYHHSHQQKETYSPSKVLATGSIMKGPRLSDIHSLDNTMNLLASITNPIKNSYVHNSNSNVTIENNVEMNHESNSNDVKLCHNNLYNQEDNHNNNYSIFNVQDRKRKHSKHPVVSRRGTLSPGTARSMMLEACMSSDDIDPFIDNQESYKSAIIPTVNNITVNGNITTIEQSLLSFKNNITKEASYDDDRMNVDVIPVNNTLLDEDESEMVISDSNTSLSSISSIEENPFRSIDDDNRHLIMQCNNKQNAIQCYDDHHFNHSNQEEAIESKSIGNGRLEEEEDNEDNNSSRANSPLQKVQRSEYSPSPINTNNEVNMHIAEISSGQQFESTINSSSSSGLVEEEIIEVGMNKTEVLEDSLNQQNHCQYQQMMAPIIVSVDANKELNLEKNAKDCEEEMDMIKAFGEELDSLLRDDIITPEENSIEETNTNSSNQEYNNIIVNSNSDEAVRDILVESSNSSDEISMDTVSSTEILMKIDSDNNFDSANDQINIVVEDIHLIEIPEILKSDNEEIISNEAIMTKETPLILDQNENDIIHNHHCLIVNPNENDIIHNHHCLIVNPNENDIIHNHHCLIVNPNHSIRHLSLSSTESSIHKIEDTINDDIITVRDCEDVQQQQDQLPMFPLLLSPALLKNTTINSSNITIDSNTNDSMILKSLNNINNNSNVMKLSIDTTSFKEIISPLKIIVQVEDLLPSPNIPVQLSLSSLSTHTLLKPPSPPNSIPPITNPSPLQKRIGCHYKSPSQYNVATSQRSLTNIESINCLFENIISREVIETPIKNNQNDDHAYDSNQSHLDIHISSSEVYSSPNMKIITINDENDSPTCRNESIDDASPKSLVEFYRKQIIPEPQLDSDLETFEMLENMAEKEYLEGLICQWGEYQQQSNIECSLNNGDCISLEDIVDQSNEIPCTSSILPSKQSLEIDSKIVNDDINMLVSKNIVDIDIPNTIDLEALEKQAEIRMKYRTETAYWQYKWEITSGHCVNKVITNKICQLEKNDS